MKKNFLAVTFILLGLSIYSSAQTSATSTENPNQAIVSSFQKYKDVSVSTIKVPTVVEITLENDFSNRFNFAVIDDETNIPQPYYFKEKLSMARVPVAINVQGRGLIGGEMLDGDTRTYTEFALPTSGQGQTKLVLTSDKLITLNGMTFFLDQYVALPTAIEIRAVTSEGEKIIVARSKMDSSSVSFPKTTAKEWTVSFTYGQILRVTEIVFEDEGAEKLDLRTLRFLAQPNHNYRVYFDADRSVSMQVGESGNLYLDKDVLRLLNIKIQTNPSYVLADTDSDSIPDIRDNCVSTANTDQIDVDGNGRGDVCDDFDRDNVINSIDNCPNDPNHNQADIDNDKIGDVCDKEESRITEKYPWLPMVGIGFAGFILLILFIVTARSMFKNVPVVPEKQ